MARPFTGWFPGPPRKRPAGRAGLEGTLSAAAYMREATFSQFTRFDRKFSRYFGRALRKSM